MDDEKFERELREPYRSEGSEADGDFLKPLLDAINAERIKAADRLLSLREESARYEKRPIETAPRDGTPILIFGGHDDCETDLRELRLLAFFRAPTRAFWDGEDWVIGFTEAGYVALVRQNPTHWMPLPEPVEPTT